MIGNLERLGQLPDDRLSQFIDCIQVSGKVRQDGELVTAEPHDKFAFADQFPQALRHLAKQLVADWMSEGIVDRFEFIKVQTQDPEFATLDLLAIEQRFQLIFEFYPVGQLGQHVVAREECQTIPCFLAFGDVFGNRHPATVAQAAAASSERSVRSGSSPFQCSASRPWNERGKN